MHVKSGTAKLNLDTFGSAGTPVLFLHGLGGSRRSWRGIPARMATSRRVVVADLRGCGASERGTEGYSFEQLGQDAVTILDALQIDRCHLVGHSLGGVVAQQLLTAHNERCASAVLVSTSSRVGEQARAGWLRLADSVEAKGLGSPESAVARGFSEGFAAAHPELVRELGNLAVACNPQVYADQARIAAGYDYTEALGSVKQPALVLQGLADRLTSPGGSVILSRAIPRAQLELLDGVGHNVHIELGDGFVEMLGDFFDRAEHP